MRRSAPLGHERDDDVLVEAAARHDLGLGQPGAVEDRAGLHGQRGEVSGVEPDADRPGQARLGDDVDRRAYAGLIEADIPQTAQVLLGEVEAFPVCGLISSRAVFEPVA
jgi:hypothetical protein